VNLPPVLGAATSAYQIEGGRAERTDSIWDMFSDQGRLANSGDVACDHFRRFGEDIALMADLGLDAYRFSISWPRVRSGGLEFYQRLVDGLLEKGITPYATLYHWDLPQEVEDAGGWPERETVDDFERYVTTVVDGLGERVENWITINEPWVAATLGYIEGVFAPGRSDWRDGLAAAHHMLLAHGRAVAVIRERSPRARVGIALDCRPSDPASPADADANRHFDGFRNRWYFDPVFGKGYPDDMELSYAKRGRWDGSVVQSGDLDAISTPLDFLGVNYYTSIKVQAGAEESEKGSVPPGPNPPRGFTEMGWENTPAALTAFLERVARDYGPPSIVVTENGASYSEWPDDQRRIDYLRDHLGAVSEARDAGLPVDGYFVWSLLDNLEWTSGFSQRFGLVHVDHSTQVRTPKASYNWYRDLIASTRR